MSKTMTVSELVNGYKEADQTFVWLRSLVGVTIVADPDPRPDFASMDVLERLAWGMRNNLSTEDFILLDIDDDVNRFVIAIADRKGLA